MSNVVYLLNGVDGNSLVSGVYDGNTKKMLTFGVGGKYINETVLSYRYSRLREIDLVSLINVNNNMEVAYIHKQEFKKFPVYADMFKVIKWFNTNPKIIFFGRRDCVLRDATGEVPYLQYLFGFNKGTINEAELQGVLEVNG